MNFIQQLANTLLAPFQFLLRLPQLLLISPRAMMGLSFPVRVGVLTFTLLTLTMLVGLLAYVFVFDGPLTGQYLARWGAMFTVAAVLSVLVYLFLIYSEPTVSPHEDIDRAWDAGMLALRQQNVDLQQVPLVLILGANPSLSDQLLKASELELSVESVPAGDQPLRWYATDEVVYLSLCDASCLGRFHQLVLQGGGSGAAADLRGTLDTSALSNSVGPGITGSGGGAAMSGSPAGQSLRGTMVVGAAAPPSAASGNSNVARPRGLAALPRDEMDHYIDRLAYLCHRIQQLRQPLCALNGVLVALPYPIVCDPVAARGISGAIRRDLHEIQRRTQLHFPVVALVTGVEAEPGFTELLRRVGTPLIKQNRFGKGISVVIEPSLENLEALAWQAAGAFEDWVYQLFGKDGGLHRPGNSRLFSMLCSIRSQVLDSLRSILGNGFSSEAVAGGDTYRPEVFVGGCYFAATGATDDVQAFVKSVFQKVEELCSDLEWTADAIRQDGRYHTMSQVIMYLNGLMIVGLLALLFVAYKLQ